MLTTLAIAAGAYVALRVVTSLLRWVRRLAVVVLLALSIYAVLWRW